jgi:hypothetical protein
MSETERPAPAPAKPWLRRKTTIAGFVLLLGIAWTLAAQQWTDKGCGTAQGYGLVVSHFGTPEHYEGCESEPGGPEYTDNYDG